MLVNKIKIVERFAFYLIIILFSGAVYSCAKTNADVIFKKENEINTKLANT
jgi:hypothetical protein